MPRKNIKNICMFMGSQSKNPYHKAAITRLCHTLAQLGFNLVWGGQNTGFMKHVGDIFAQYEGVELIGIRTEQVAIFGDDHPACTKLIICKDEKERNDLYQEHADAFIALTGGFGSFKEIADQIARIYVDGMEHFYKKKDYTITPFFFLNTMGYWNHTIGQCREILDGGYSPLPFERVFWPSREKHSTPAEILHQLELWENKQEEVWESIRRDLEKLIPLE